MRIYIAILLFFLLFMVETSTANAQSARPKINQVLPINQVLRISPIILPVDLTPGKTQTFIIKIDNLLNQGLGIHAELEGFSQIDEINGGISDILPENNPLISWSYIKKSDIIMGARESKNLDLSITTPRNAPKRGYYEILFLTPIYSNQQDPTAPTVVSRIGVLVLATNGKINYSNLKQKVSIPNFAFSHLFYDTNSVSSIFRVKNDYFTHFTAKPFLSITPLFGKSSTTILTEKRVLPGQTRLWTEQITRVPGNHIFYQAKLAVSIGNGEQLYATSYFFIFPFKRVLIFMGVVLLLGFIYLRRKQLARAYTIIVRGK